MNHSNMKNKAAGRYKRGTRKCNIDLERGHGALIERLTVTLVIQLTCVQSSIPADPTCVFQRIFCFLPSQCDQAITLKAASSNQG